MKTGIYAGVVIILILVVFFLVHQKTVKRSDSSYTQVFSSATKDFTCADGSFYSFSVDPKTEGVFNFYPTPESLKTVKGNSTYGNPPWPVGIGGSAKGDDLVIDVSSDDGYTALLSSMAGCKNVEGKSPVEVYKVTRVGSHN